MIITIRIPDDTVKMQFATQTEEKYEMWFPVKYGDLVAVQREDKDGGAADEDTW